MTMQVMKSLPPSSSSRASRGGVCDILIYYYLLYGMTASYNGNNVVIGDKVSVNMALTPFSHINVEADKLLSYQFASTVTECGAQCAANESCLAFFYLETYMKMMSLDHIKYEYEPSDQITPEAMKPEPETETDDGNNSGGGEVEYEIFNCLLLYDRLTSAEITTGNGVLGIVKEILLPPADGNGDDDDDDDDDDEGGGGDSPPTFQQADLMYATRTRRGPVAVYKCSNWSRGFTTFGWMYDNDAKRWPWIDKGFEACSNTICDYPEMSATIFQKKQKFDDIIITFGVFCDNRHEYMECNEASCYDDGFWYVYNNDDAISYHVSCISNRCYRLDYNGVAQYWGTDNTTLSGQTCLRWDTQPYFFLSDSNAPYYDGNVTGMNNYCRDPYMEGVQSCVVEDGPSMGRMEPCNIPLCQWSPYYT